MNKDLTEIRWILALSLLAVLMVGCEKKPLSPIDREEVKMTREITMDSNESKFPQTDDEWKQRLTAEEYHILREKGTERAFSGKYDKFFEPGLYTCSGCGSELFVSDDKYNSGCGWPAFSAPADQSAVKESRDASLARVRTEITCSKCGGHLGHVFNDGPPETGLRYCINSAALDFEEEKETE